MCSFSSPNLSFWALFPLADGATVARKLPDGDRHRSEQLKVLCHIRDQRRRHPSHPGVGNGLSLGATSAWINSDCVAIDPLLAEKFPALFDYFAEPQRQFHCWHHGCWLCIPEPNVTRTAAHLLRSMESSLRSMGLVSLMRTVMPTNLCSRHTKMQLQKAVTNPQRSLHSLTG